MIFIIVSDPPMHCGKPYRDTCTTKEECSSKICYDDGTCGIQRIGPSDSESMSVVNVIFVIIILMIVLFIGMVIFKKCFNKKKL